MRSVAVSRTVLSRLSSGSPQARLATAGRRQTARIARRTQRSTAERSPARNGAGTDPLTILRPTRRPSYASNRKSTDEVRCRSLGDRGRPKIPHFGLEREITNLVTWLSRLQGKVSSEATPSLGAVAAAFSLV